MAHMSRRSGWMRMYRVLGFWYIRMYYAENGKSNEKDNGPCNGKWGCKAVDSKRVGVSENQGSLFWGVTIPR